MVDQAKPDSYTAGYNAGWEAAQLDFDLKIRDIANRRYIDGVLDGRDMAGSTTRRWYRWW